MEDNEAINKSVLEVLLDRGPCNMRVISIVLNTELNVVETSLKLLLRKKYIVTSTEGHSIVGGINIHTYVCIRPTKYESVINYINN